MEKEGALALGSRFYSVCISTRYLSRSVLLSHSCDLAQFASSLGILLPSTLAKHSGPYLPSLEDRFNLWYRPIFGARRRTLSDYSPRCSSFGVGMVVHIFLVNIPSIFDYHILRCDILSIMPFEHASGRRSAPTLQSFLHNTGVYGYPYPIA